jgi:hypothetical protein
LRNVCADSFRYAAASLRDNSLAVLMGKALLLVHGCLLDDF